MYPIISVVPAPYLYGGNLSLKKLTRNKGGYTPKRERVMQHAEPEGKTILDLCTGKGRFAIEFAKAGASKVVGIDISHEMLNIARDRARFEGVEDIIDFGRGTVDKIPCDNDSFDVSVSIQSLMHVPNLNRSISELARVTKTGGLIIIDHENKYPYWRIIIGSKKSLALIILLSFFSSGVGLKLVEYLRDSLRYNKWERMKPIMTGIDKYAFQDIITNNGLRIIKTYDFGPSWCWAYHLVICKKI